MNRRAPVVLALSLVLAAPAVGATPSAARPGNGRGTDPASALVKKPSRVAFDRPVHVPGELVVEFEPRLRPAKRAGLHRRAGASVARRMPGSGMELVRVPHGRSVADAAREYLASPDVVSAEPNAYRYPAGGVPNDPRFAEQWGLDNTGQSHPASNTATQYAGRLDADMDVANAGDPGAWDSTTGSAEVVVAVIDSGVDVTHPDLDDRLWVNPDEVAGNGVDDDGNGYVDDVHGWDTAENDASLLAGSSVAGFDHGTHVAGIIGAERNNGAGIAGACGGDGASGGCRIMVLKFMEPIDTNEDGTPDTMAGDLVAELEAIEYAIEQGADIINGSFGSVAWSAAERRAFQDAGAAGILSVLAAGNESLDNDMVSGADLDGDGFFDVISPSYPASYTVPSILSVAASNHHDEHAYETHCYEQSATQARKDQCAFTSWGRDSVDVAAPGVDVVSTVPGNGYETFDGTSMAAPHVAGVAGLVWSLSGNEGLTPLQVKNKIMRSVDTSGLPLNTVMPTLLNVGSGVPSPTGAFTRTRGRVNALAALTASTANATTRTDGNIDGARSLSSPQRGSVAWPADVNDVYKRTLRRGHRYRFTLAVPSGVDADLYLWSPGTTEIWQQWWTHVDPPKLARASFAGPGADESFTFKPRRRGTHYVHVSSWFSAGSYTLRVRCLTC